MCVVLHISIVSLKVLLVFLFIFSCLGRPSTPEVLKLTNKGPQSYTISWTEPNVGDVTRPVSNYRIKLKLKSDNEIEEIVSVPHNQTQYNFTDLIPGSQYEVSVAASNQVGSSNYSDARSFNTSPSGRHNHI